MEKSIHFLRADCIISLAIINNIPKQGKRSQLWPLRKNQKRKVAQARSVNQKVKKTSCLNRVRKVGRYKFFLHGILYVFSSTDELIHSPTPCVFNIVKLTPKLARRVAKVFQKQLPMYFPRFWRPGNCVFFWLSSSREYIPPLWAVLNTEPNVYSSPSPFL